jgi:hypothetical protein
MGDQSQMLSEAKGRVHLTPPISSTAHASREAGRCSVGLPRTVAAARGARKKGQSNRATRQQDTTNLALSSLISGTIKVLVNQ